MELFYWLWWGLGGSAGWASFYDAFREFGIVKSEKFDRFVEFLSLGVWDAICLRGYCIVCSTPTAVHLDRPDLPVGQRRLHRLDGPAVEWHDGARGYWVAGVRMEPKVFEKPETLTVKRITSERNAELRKGLIQLMGVERFCSEADAKVLDTDTDHAGMPRRLLSLNVGSGPRWCVVEVECPSKRDKHYLWVPPGMERCSQAVAWTFGFEGVHAPLYAPKIEA